MKILDSINNSLKSPYLASLPPRIGQLHLYSNPSQTVILRSEATKNLVLPMDKRDSSLPAVAQNDKFAKHQDKCDCPTSQDRCSIALLSFALLQGLEYNKSKR